ncbi:MAG: class I SAM-dependent methyltransferase [Thermodesulfobacteriota bacterium]|nr:class I SAM-dependent methyltransferase [Thermodesulfobacteriota bacterium]
MDIEMEEIDCPFCGGPKHLLLHREDSLQMVRCSSCRFIYLNPRPTSRSLLRFYQDYLPEDESSVEAWQRMMQSIFQKAANLIERYKKRGRLLDVGAGFGFFLSEMRGRGWEVVGVEISRKAMDYAKDVLGLTLHLGPLEKVGFPESDFDVVSGFYVIEHLPDPMAFLKECYRILKPGGLLLLRYPHTTPIKNLLRFFGIENRLYDLPAHLSDFSPKMIQQCLEKAGFKEWRHFIGGYTLPREPGKKIASSVFGNLSEALFHMSGKRFLLPGVSKTVLGFKG